MKREKGFAYCGLACCLCSENDSCPGCKNEGCKNKEWCKSFNCCKEKGLNGCWECNEFPCDNPMFKKLKITTFAKLISELGEKEFIEILDRNEKNGIIYHFDGIIGDYDNFNDEEKLREFIFKGKKL